MTGNFIVVGDRHSHGGVLTQGCDRADIDGRAIVRLGDIAICPLHGPTFVATASSRVEFYGADAACPGDTLACGAQLIASQTRVARS